MKVAWFLWHWKPGYNEVHVSCMDEGHGRRSTMKVVLNPDPHFLFGGVWVQNYNEGCTLLCNILAMCSSVQDLTRCLLKEESPCTIWSVCWHLWLDNGRTEAFISYSGMVWKCCMLHVPLTITRKFYLHVHGVIQLPFTILLVTPILSLRCTPIGLSGGRAAERAGGPGEKISCAECAKFCN